MQAILLVLGAQTQELLFLLNQFQQSVVQISLYQDLKRKDVQIVQDLERLVIKFSLFSVSGDKMCSYLPFLGGMSCSTGINYMVLFIYFEVCACWEKNRWVIIKRGEFVIFLGVSSVALHHLRDFKTVTKHIMSSILQLYKK